MIPKKIHYCWFSNDPYPQLVQDCIASWKEYMPDWDFVLWNYDKIKDIDSIWLKECIAAKKWAFAADFVRLWAVYYEGGIYLDSDVLIFQSLDPFLKDRLFIGRESVEYITFENKVQVYLTSHCFGAEAFHPFIHKNLLYYKDRHFQGCTSKEIPNNLRYEMLMMPYIQGCLAELWGYDARVGIERQTLRHGIEIYPPYYFCWTSEYPDNIESRYAQHLGQGSWREPEHWEHFEQKPYTLGYKLRWRFVLFLKKIAEKLDYRLIRVHPDGRL